VADAVHPSAKRLELALELADLGAELYATKMKREHPDWCAERIEHAVVAWFQTRPGAEHGDADGPRVPWPKGDA